MRKYALLVCLLFFGASSAFAMLPPLYHGLAELKAIVNHQAIGEKLPSGEMIEEIAKQQDGYLIYTRGYVLSVSVIYIPQEILGPGKFELQFGDVERR